MAAARDIDRLYGLPLTEFTSARNALVRDLRKADRKDDADEVRRLKKPSVTAWAVNQLARREPGKVDELIKAGDALRKAQRDVLGGKEADVREVTRRQHELADELLDSARDLLTEAGTRPTQAASQRISTTLRAASTDPATAKLLHDGRLTEDVESIGFGPLLHVAPKGRRAGTKAPARRRARREADRRKVDAAKAQLREEREALNAAEREAKTARRAAEQAERAAERAAARVEAAERRLANAARAR